MSDELLKVVEIPANALQESMINLLNAVPNIITAILILALGWVIAKITELIVKKILLASRIDEWIIEKKLNESLFNVSITNTISLTTKYYIIIIFLKEASIRAGLEFLSDLFDALLKALPEVFIGIGIIVISLVFADFVKKRIKTAIMPFNESIAETVYGVIMFFAIVMALPKFGLTNTGLLEDSFKYLVLGISLGISLAIGIGFGWAIKEGPAKNLLKKKRK